MTIEFTVDFYRRSIEQALIINNSNIIDQASQLANQLAKNKSFVYEIGLDEYEEDVIAQRLRLLVAFILAMYNAAEAIIKNIKYKTLDERAIAIIDNRIGLMSVPLIAEGKTSQEKYAEHCYLMHLLKMTDESVKNWEDMKLSEQFFEICLCVFREELKLEMPDLHLFQPQFEEISSRRILGSAFKGVFLYVKWELDDIAAIKKVVLYPKKSRGPDSNLKEYPLLYLYFDDFSEIAIAWNKQHFELWKHDSDIRSCKYSREKIMQDEKLFLELYKNNLLRLRLWDGTEIFKKIEENYWNRIKNPAKYADDISFRSDMDPELIAMRKELRNKINNLINAIKLRYGLTTIENT
jgi:hypothetical protein